MRSALLFWRSAAVAIACLLWFGHPPGTQWVKPAPSGYYEMLTDAVTSGQTYLKLSPDPRLKALANPWAGAQGIPRLHDATYFNDRYYLYFGVAPVAVLYAPWRILTGTYLSDGAGTVVFCVAGFLLSAWFFMRVRRRFFPSLPSWWVAVAILTIGLGTYLPHQVQNTDFYLVPIACAFACGMGAANALFEAVVAARIRRRTVSLAIASLAIGAAVGARPDYVVGLAVVAIAAVAVMRAGGGLAAALAAVVPAALCGAALASYNYARFGHALDFGIKNQFAAVDMHNLKLFGLEHVGYVARQYFFAARDLNLYYPFVRQPTENIGLVPWAPLAVVGLAFPLTLLSRGRRRADWILGVGLPWLAVCGNLAMLLGYFYVFERYNTEFLPGLVLIGCVVVSAVIASPARGWGRRLGVAALLAVVGYTLLHSVLRSVPTDMGRPGVRTFARTLNLVASGVERLRGLHHGPVDLRIEFAEGTAGASEILLATGRGRDLLFVRYLGPRQAQLGFFHTGSGGPLSDPFEFEPGRSYQLHVDLGSLYPPLAHSIFSGWADDEIAALQRRVDVRLDGRSLLEFSSDFHSAEPASLQLGRNPDSPGDQPFRGRLTAIERPGLPPRASVAAAPGPRRIEFEIPPFAAMVGQPLLATGRSGAGDLLYIFYVGPNQVKFGHDSWSNDLFETGTVYYDPGALQTLEVDMGSLHPGSVGPQPLQLRFNGRVLADRPRPFHPSTLSQVALGNNAIHASTAEVNFNGPRIRAVPLAAFPGPETTGALYLTLRPPAAPPPGWSDPLVTTGETGAGEFVFLRYPDPGHVRVGYDRWGYGGPVSEPVAIAPGQDIEVEVSLGALYPEAPAPGWDPAAWSRLRSTVRIRVNGQVALQAKSESYPTRPDQVFPAANPIGGSTAAGRFSGEVRRIERIGPLRMK